MNIKAAIVNKKKAKFEFEDLEIASPASHEVLIKVVATGLCHTDLSVKDGYLPTNYPVVLGHEGAGIIEKVGDHVTNLKKGDHVVLSYGSCGHCRPCMEGDAAYCNQFNPLNFLNERQGNNQDIFTSSKKSKGVNGAFFQQSSFATYALAHERNTVKISKKVDLRMMGPLGCGIQTGAGTVMNTLNPKPGSSIAVYGVGSVGLAAIMAAKNAGCASIIAVDVNPKRLKIAKELGATHMINSSKSDPVEKIRSISLDNGVDYTVEASGIKEVATQAFQSLANRGTLAIVGAPPGKTKYAFDANEMILSGRKVIGVVEGDSVVKVYIPKLIELYQQGRFPFDKLIKYYKFKDINKAVKDMEDGKVIKPILEM